MKQHPPKKKKVKPLWMIILFYLIIQYLVIEMIFQYLVIGMIFAGEMGSPEHNTEFWIFTITLLLLPTILFIPAIKKSWTYNRAIHFKRINLQKEYQFCKAYLEKIKWYAVFAIGLFALCFIIGFAYPYFFREHIINLITELFDLFEGKGFTATVIAIFFNNVKTSFFVALLGVLFGIFPLAIIILNGYLTGFVSREAANMLGLSVLWRLVPHGILELPAVMFSVGIGLRLGHKALQGKQQLNKELTEAMRFFFFIVVPVLFIAAIIEATFLFLLP